jgi:hypothetical protein
MVFRSWQMTGFRFDSQENSQLKEIGNADLSWLYRKSLDLQIGDAIPRVFS